MCLSPRKGLQQENSGLEEGQQTTYHQAAHAPVLVCDASRIGLGVTGVSVSGVRSWSCGPTALQHLGGVCVVVLLLVVLVDNLTVFLQRRILHHVEAETAAPVRDEVLLLLDFELVLFVASVAPQFPEVHVVLPGSRVLPAQTSDLGSSRLGQPLHVYHCHPVRQTRAPPTMLDGAAIPWRAKTTPKNCAP